MTISSDWSWRTISDPRNGQNGSHDRGCGRDACVDVVDLGGPPCFGPASAGSPVSRSDAGKKFDGRRPRSSEGRHSAIVAGRRWFAPVRGRFRSIAAATFGALAFYLAAMVLSLTLLETHVRGIAQRADGAIWRFSPDAWSTRSNLRMTSAYKDPDSDLTSPPYGTYSIIRIFVGPSTRYRMPRQSTTRRRIEDNNAAG